MTGSRVNKFSALCLGDRHIVGHAAELAKELKWAQAFPNFTPWEVSCKGFVVQHVQSLIKLQQLRINMKMPLFLDSAYRTPEHNKIVGGAEHSQHLLGRAYDIPLVRPANIYFPSLQSIGDAIEEEARALGFKGFGRYNTFIHIDNRDGPEAYWDERS